MMVPLLGGRRPAQPLPAVPLPADWRRACRLHGHLVAPLPRRCPLFRQLLVQEAGEQAGPEAKALDVEAMEAGE